MTTSADGTLADDVVLRANATLGYYTIRIGDINDGAMGSFRVEEYRKPEYQVKVNAAKPRVLQGDKMQVTIDSRYFFGEPVANAAVKYRVYHSPHTGGGMGRTRLIRGWELGKMRIQERMIRWGMALTRSRRRRASWMRMAS